MFHREYTPIGASLIGGITAGIASSMPVISFLNLCCCLLVVGGGVLASALYARSRANVGLEFESGDALIIGISTGIVVAVVTTVLPLMMLAFSGMDYKESILTTFEEVRSSMGVGGTAEMDQVFDELEALLNTYSNSFFVLLQLFFSLLIYPIFTIAGAFLGHSLFRKKNISPQV